uniref:Protein Rev n=1 Tax=Ovine maedi visna related virus (strain South Africa) TaxID=11664 RepID=REV_OMVVS|nr:RecName: Full=Protein Rev [Ovine lentivirus (strain SA-OMVV)]pir/F46335/ trans-regulatory splicing protein - Maedi/Visna virus (strain SA-OMVV) [Visna-maedi virus]AAA66816.1 rev protein [Ovine lentivirus]
MASSKNMPSRITQKSMEPPLRETWQQVVQEMVMRKQRDEEEKQNLVTGLQASSGDPIYTGNSSDRSTRGPGGKTKRRKGWFQWLRKLRAREKNIPSQFYPDMEGNCAGLENLTLGEGMEENPIYDSTAATNTANMDGRNWMEWR